MMSRQKSDDSLTRAFKNEFRLENFSLNFEKNTQFLEKEPEVVLEYFHTTIWPCCNRLIYLIYRVAIAIYYTIWFVESIIRNAEFVSKDMKMTSKKDEKISLFSIHPWPLYMTSWSLTILFVHLWIAAFISLYFYSINEKSWLNNLFSHLFGPFSCTRSLSVSSTHSSDFQAHAIRKKQQKSCFSNIFRSLFFKKAPKAEIYHVNNRPTTNLLSQEPSDCDKSSGKTNEIKLNLEAGDINPTELANNQQIIFIPNIQENVTARALTSKNSHRTYCINKSHCNIPSAIVIYNRTSWKLWIDAHVPNFVLILIKIDWLLNNLVAISALMVTCIYFSYAYLVDLEAEPTWVHELGNVHRHGINSLVALVDVIMLGYPIRILHFVFVIVYGWVYAFVTFLYWFSDPVNHVIYDQIDYKNPMKIMTAYLFLTILVFLMQVTHFLAYRLKLLIRTKYFDNECENCLNIGSDGNGTPVAENVNNNNMTNAVDGSDQTVKGVAYKV